MILGAAAPLVINGSGHKGFFLFVAVLSIIVTTILLILCLLNVQNKFLSRYWSVIVSY